MPRKYKKKNAKKKNTTRVSGYNPRGTPSGMPRTRRAYLRYADNVSITSTSGTMGSHLFRSNSCYDPDYTSTGHQPMGWDQWFLLYNHYVVVGAKISVTCLSDNSADAPYAFGVYLTDSTTAPYTTWSGFREARQGSQRLITGGATTNKTCSTTFSAKKFYNVTDIKDNIDRLGALVNSDPTEGAYFVVYYQNITSYTDTTNFMVTIDYIVDFSEPKNLALS